MIEGDTISIFQGCLPYKPPWKGDLEQSQSMPLFMRYAETQEIQRGLSLTIGDSLPFFLFRLPNLSEILIFFFDPKIWGSRQENSSVINVQY